MIIFLFLIDAKTDVCRAGKNLPLSIIRVEYLFFFLKMIFLLYFTKVSKKIFFLLLKNIFFDLLYVVFNKFLNLINT